VKTAEEVKAELKSVVAEFFAAVESLMNQGQSFATAVASVCRARPDLVEKESSLRDHLKALGTIEQSLSAADLLAWSERHGAGAICAAATELKAAVSRLPIAQLGVRYKGKQKIEITRPMLAEVVANFRKRDTGEVPIDYDHSIEMAAGSGDPVPAAGWIKSLDDRPDGQGILWGTVQWTPKAARMIAAGEYKYVSPVIDPTVRDNKTGNPQGWTLTSAALTNQPVLQGMPPLVLSARGTGEASGSEGQTMNNDKTMGYVDQDWDPAELEIAARTQRLMAANKQLSWAAAEDAVMRADPGLVQASWNAIQTELTRRVLMAEHGQLNYAQALQAVMIDDQNLCRRYYAVKARVLATPDIRPLGNQDDEIGLEIRDLVQQNIAASEGRLDYASATKAVLAQRPDIALRLKNSMR
jgi:hypothetical protein